MKEVRFFEGPLDGQVMVVERNLLEVQVAEYIDTNGVLLVPQDPQDPPPARINTRYYAYRVHCVTMVSYPFRGIGYAGVPIGKEVEARALVGEVPLAEIEELPGPDFIEDFDGWFKRQVAIHCKWTIEHRLRQLALDRLLFDWGVSVWKYERR